MEKVSLCTTGGATTNGPVPRLYFCQLCQACRDCNIHGHKVNFRHSAMVVKVCVQFETWFFCSAPTFYLTFAILRGGLQVIFPRALPDNLWLIPADQSPYKAAKLGSQPIPNSEKGIAAGKSLKQHLTAQFGGLIKIRSRTLTSLLSRRTLSLHFSSCSPILFIISEFLIMVRMCEKQSKRLDKTSCILTCCTSVPETFSAFSSRFPFFLCFYHLLDMKSEQIQ